MTTKKLSLTEIVLLGCYGVVFFGLFLYSFTQIDLSLTFSRIAFLRELVGSFQHIGYFDRPLSTYLYLAIVVGLTVLYLFFLRRAAQNKLKKTFVWMVIGFGAIVLTFSYNAFSYDIFNYMFDAKIITYYHENPYMQKALDYPGDPMLSFMRWTHRVYPYGPVWLGLTVPLSFLGFQLFLPTFFLFKVLLSISFIGAVFFIGKIFQKIKPEREVFALVFFGLNPLVIIESLVSGHLDIAMIFFSLFALYAMIQKKYVNSYILFFLSVGVKFVTAVLFPVFIAVHFLEYKKQRRHWELVFGMSLILLITGVVIASQQSGNFQPWYLLVPLSFAVFLSHRYYILIPSVVISVFALFRYVPFLYLGNWDAPVPRILSALMLTSYGIAFVVTIGYFIYRHIVVVRKRKRGISDK